MSKSVLFLLPLLMLFGCIGCSNGRVALSGRVVYSDDETPLEQGTVAFQSEKLQARGEIGEDGRYVIGFLDESDGLPPGKYRVFVTGAEVRENSDDNTEADSGDIPVMIPLIDPKYAKADTSGITVEVDSKLKTFDFKVERHPNRKNQ